MEDELPLSVRDIESLHRRELDKKVFMGLRETYLWHLAKTMPHGARLIAPGSNPYLLRIYLTPRREEIAKRLLLRGLPSVVAQAVMKSPRPFLHYFFRGDTDRAFHNHPWEESLSFVLTTGYQEHRWNFRTKRTETRVIRPGSFNLIRRDDYHRVELLPEGGCWTLFLSGRPVTGATEGQEWGFYDQHRGRFIPWSQWVDLPDMYREGNDSSARLDRPTPLTGGSRVQSG